MAIDTSERQFESDIEASLIAHQNAIKVDPSLYDRESMLFPRVLIDFLESSQPKEWLRYKKFYGIHAEEKLIRRLKNAIEEFGVLDILKNGFSDIGDKGGVRFRVCYFKPDSLLNGTLNDLYSKNIIGVTRQFPYSTDNHKTIDMVLSINGIPVFAFELKNQLKGQDFQCAITQWKMTRNPNEPIFRFNRRFLAYFAVDLYEVWMTTALEGEKTRFLPFNQGSNGPGNPGGKGNPANSKNGYVTSYLWERVFQRDSMLDLIGRFITITEEKRVVTVNGKMFKSKKKNLIFPRFHQYDVVHKVLEDVKKNGAGRNYLIEHSAGSGKSNSIAWIAYRLASVFYEEETPIFDTVIIVTNRIVLDSQLQDTIESFDHKAGLVEAITQSKKSRGLIDAINDRRKIIVCTIQKFLYAYKEFGDIKGRNFAIIVDEAHQGQSGESARTLRKSLVDQEAEKKKYAEENDINVEDIDENDELMQEILTQGHHDNQSFFAFTATPIKKSLQVFGTQREDGQYHPFHVYSMKQAIEEGFILDVLQDYLTIKQAFKLAKDTEANPELLEGSAKRALFKYYKSHDFTIQQKVDIIMDNFLHNGRMKIGGNGKAMVVCDSRHNAVKFYFEIKDYIKNHPDTCQGVDVLVAFSGSVEFEGDDAEYLETKLNVDSNGRYIDSDKKFREAFHGPDFNIMVVANKYQTGYDEPYLHSMYVDKRLKGVNAVQTLSRLNRTCLGKEDTFVLDFENTADDIRKAFEPFYGETSLQGDLDFNAVYDLWRKIEQSALFDISDVNKFYEAMNKNGRKKKQSATAIGEISSLAHPVVERYCGLEKEERYRLRDTMMKFVRSYAFITQLVRIEDKDLFKGYLFVSHLIRLLPKSEDDRINISDKVLLEYANLKETYRGSIVLEEGLGAFAANRVTNEASREKIVDTLDRIIDKVNQAYEGEFDSADKVSVQSVFNMMMQDKVVKKKLKGFAKKDDAKLFIESIFPSEFQRVLTECFEKNFQAFSKLLTDEAYQKGVMNIMAKEFYKTLSSERPDGE